MKRTLDIIILLFAIVLIFILVYPQYKASKPTIAKIGCDFSVSSLPLFVAEEQGFFKNQKVEAQLLFYNDPEKALKDLFSDTIQCGIFPWFSILKRTTNNESVKVFLSEEFREAVPMGVIVTKRGSRIKLLEDLKGKRLGIPPWCRGIISYIVPGVEIAEEKPQELFSLLDKGDVDAILLLEPYRTLAIEKGLQVIEDAPFSLLLIPFPANGIGVSSRFLYKNKGGVKRMVIALDNALGFINKNPGKARDILAKYLKVKENPSFHLPRFQRLSEIDIPNIQSLSTRLEEKGYLSKPVNPKSLTVPPILLH